MAYRIISFHLSDISFIRKIFGLHNKYAIRIYDISFHRYMVFKIRYDLMIYLYE